MNNMTFIPAVVNPDRVAINPPTRVRFDRVRADEILIVVMVLLVWAGAVYIFFNQWGKLHTRCSTWGTFERAYLLLLYQMSISFLSSDSPIKEKPTGRDY